MATELFSQDERDLAMPTGRIAHYFLYLIGKKEINVPLLRSLRFGELAPDLKIWKAITILRRILLISFHLTNHLSKILSLSISTDFLSKK